MFISSGHDLFGSLLVTILIGRVSLYIVTLAQSSCVVRDFLLVMSGNGVMTKTNGAATKPGAFCVCAHTQLCCSARAGIAVSSCNPL
jgi:hypothetical protein